MKKIREQIIFGVAIVIIIIIIIIAVVATSPYWILGLIRLKLKGDLKPDDYGKSWGSAS